MTEPITAAAVGAVGAGAAAGLMATLGIEAQPVFWALCGASLGLSAAADAGKVRAAAVFAAVVMCSTLFGTWLAAKYFGGEPLSRNAVACVMGMFFHPLLNASVAKLPQVLDALFRKLGGT